MEQGSCKKGSKKHGSSYMDNIVPLKANRASWFMLNDPQVEI